MKTAKLLRSTLFLMLVALIQTTALYAQTTSEQPGNGKTIMLISGAFVTNEGWGEWKAYFESKGYKVITPSWSYKDGTVASLREKYKDSISSELELKQIVDYHAQLIDQMPEKPILIGHSFGGLIVQLLLQRDKGAMGIAYHSVPPKGTFTLKYSFLKSLWGPLGLFKSTENPFLMSFTQWQYAFTNGMPESEQRYYYDKLVVPEARKVLRAPLKAPGKIDFKKAHVPLLFVSGSTDNIIPASLNKKNYERYKKHEPAGSVTDYKEFPGRNHLAMSQPNWKEDADYILEWINNNK
jgi:pimeloyl-ACP methyl ester carboxylesterase